MYTDEMLTCVDCGQQFPFTSGEQEFFAMKGFTNKPSRCTDCRAARKAGRSPNGGGARSSSQREMFQATCSQCGVRGGVPFAPRGDKAVLLPRLFRQPALVPLGTANAATRNGESLPRA